MSIDADIETVKTYVSRLGEDIELVEEDEIRQAIKKYCTKPVCEEGSATIADMLSELCTLSLHRRCERTAKYLQEFHKEEEKQETEIRLTLDGVCSQLNTLSDLGVLYCIDPTVPGNPIPALIIKIVRDDMPPRLWRVTDRLTEKKAREELAARSRTIM